MRKVAVIGAGTMGNGIAHVAALSGFDVTLVDVSKDLLDGAVNTISGNLQRGVDKGKLAAEKKDEALSRIRTAADVQDAGDADLVVEAIIEKFEAKRELFQKLDALTPPETILASNTSSISITRLAAVTRRPDKVIGMHFFNPVPVMTLVEVIRGMATSDATYQVVEDLSKRMGKTPIEVNDY